MIVSVFRTMLDNFISIICIVSIILLQITMSLPIKVEHEINYNQTKHMHMTIRHLNFLAGNCSMELGEYGNKECKLAHVEVSITEYNRNLLLDTLLKIDGNYVIRRIYIQIINYSRNLTRSRLGSDMDTFLTPRPWWIILKEKYVGNSVQLHSQGFKSSQHTGNSLHHASFTLLRYKQEYEPRLRYLAALQYPPLEECGNMKLLIGHFVNSGFGTVMLVYSGLFNRHFDTVADIYDSNTNNYTEGINYLSTDECPGLANRRQCVYLPMTNCTLPKILTDSNTSQFKMLFQENTVFVFSQANSSGKLIHNFFENDIEEVPSNYLMLQRKILKFVQNIPQLDFSNPFYEGYNLLEEINGNGKVSYVSGVDDLLPRYAFLLRLNYRFRHLVEHNIHELKKSSFKAWSNHKSNDDHFRCTAIHIRRGDRIIPDVDMQEYCSNVIRNTTGCYQKDNPNIELSCAALEDYACFNNKSFGALTLLDYLNRAYEIYPTYNVFVATDGTESWIQQEMKKVDTRWNILYIAAKEDSRDQLSPNATMHGIDFWSSIALSRQCQAFVGHLGSAVSLLMLQAMCFHHGNQVAKCPIACHIGGKFIVPPT